MKKLTPGEDTQAVTSKRPGGTSRGKKRYQPPTIESYGGDEVLEEIGPAQGYSGDPTTIL